MIIKSKKVILLQKYGEQAFGGTRLIRLPAAGGGSWPGPCRRRGRGGALARAGSQLWAASRGWHGPSRGPRLSPGSPL